MASAGSDLGRFMEPVARALLGEPNEPLSNASELRFGTNGSWSVDRKTGVIFSHELDQGGGVLWLVEHRLGLTGAEAFDYLRDDLHLPIEDARPNGRANGKHRGNEAERVVEAVYDYIDEAGTLLYQTVRYNFRNPDGSFAADKDGKRRKTFAQRRPDGNGGFVYNLKDTRLVPYRLPELIEAIGQDRQIFVVEGEKKADLLWSIGVPATCAPMGAGKWPDSFAEIFRGARVVIIPDNDEPGRKHADLVGAALTGVAAEVRLLELPGLPPKGDVVEWHAAGGDVEQLYALAESAPVWSADTAAPFISNYGATPWEHLDDPGPELEHLVDGWTTVGGKSIIGGPSKSGKSFLAIHKGLCIARAVPFFGNRVMAPGLVIYQAGEGALGVKKRLRAYRKHFAVPPGERVPFVLLRSKIDLYGVDGDTAPLIEEIKAITKLYDVPLRAVFIDTLATATGGADENSGRDMSAVMANVDRINDATGAHVCLVHHMNAAGTKLRGHTSVYANIDQVITVTRDETTKIRTAVLDKQKDGEDGLSIRFELFSVEVGRRAVDDKPITSCVTLEVGEKDVARRAEASKGFRLTQQEEIVFRALVNALAEGGQAPPIGFNIPDGVTVVQYKAWRDAYARSAPIDDDDTRKKEAAIKKAMQRAGATLLKFGIIGRDTPWIWWTGKPVRGFAKAAIEPAPAPPTEPSPDPAPADDNMQF